MKSEMTKPRQKITSWRVMCAHCRFKKFGLDDRDEAIAEGRAHIKEKHANDEEWEFRIQGIAGRVHAGDRR